MAAAKKVGLTDANMNLLRVLNVAAGKKTPTEIAAMLSTKDKQYKKGSVVTAISVLKKELKENGIAFPAYLNPKREEGGGRKSHRVDIAEGLSSLGIVFERIADDEDSDDTDSDSVEGESEGE